MTQDTAQRRVIIGGHYYCEDPWYSCPLAENGCANEAIDETVCTCGYDDRVKALDAALQQARREALEEAVKKVCPYCADRRWAPMGNSGYHLCNELGPNPVRCQATEIHLMLDRLREGVEGT